MMTAQEVIELLNLKPLPGEGGYYRETYRSALRHSADKCAGTAIYYLLTPDTCSVMHRLPTDEVYHFYFGDPVEMLLLSPQGGSVVTLGNDLQAGHKPQFVVTAGTWQGSCLREGGRFALMGTTMAPGFEFSDFEAGARDELIRAHPRFEDQIRRLTIS